MNLEHLLLRDLENIYFTNLAWLEKESVVNDTDL